MTELQEPVAWHEPGAFGNVTTHKQWAAENGWMPLYTAPPQKEWVGLTDADIAKAMHGSVEGSNVLPYQFARTIEQALKERNT